MAIDFPNSPVDGQVFSVGPMTWVYTVAGGGVWQSYVGGGRAIVSDTAPSSPITGDLWYESDTGKLFIWYDSFWVEVSASSGGGASVVDLTNPRNVIINGDFQVWQRGPTPEFVNFGGSADLWVPARDGTGATVAITRQNESVGGGGVPAGAQFLRFNMSVAGTAGTYNNLLQRVEDVRTLAGQTVTFSFYAKADTGRSFTVKLTQLFGSGGSANVSTASFPFTVGTTWQRYSVTFTLASVSGKTWGTGNQVLVEFQFPLATVQTVDLWGVQLEAGAAATPFEVRRYDEVLRQCQRYFVQFNSNNNYAPIGAAGVVYNATSGNRVTVPLPVPMRAIPSVTWSNISLFDGEHLPFVTSMTPFFSPDNPTMASLDCTASAGGLVQWRPAMLLSMNGLGGWIRFSAEL